MRSDVYTQQVQLPMKIRALTIDNPDGTYTVLVNADLADDVKLEAHQHEMEHIDDDHFELGQLGFSADLIERIAHGGQS